MEHKRRKTADVGEDSVNEKVAKVDGGGTTGDAMIQGEKRKVEGEGGDEELHKIREALEELEETDRRAKKKRTEKEGLTLDDIEEFGISNISIAEEVLAEKWIAEIKEEIEQKL